LHHRQIIANTVPTVVQLLEHLQTAGVTGLRMPQEREITDFVTANLYRQRADRDDLHPWADSSQVRLFHRLEADITALDAEPCELTLEAVQAISAHEAARVAVAEEARTTKAET
jgi:hypothetical protein